MPSLYKSVELLKTYNRWRRGESEFAWKGKPEPLSLSPREIGEAIDTVVEHFKDSFNEGSHTLELGKIAYKGNARINPLAVTVHFGPSEFSLCGIVYNQTHTGIVACGDIFGEILYKVDDPRWEAIAKLYRKHGATSRKPLCQSDLQLVKGLVFG